MTIEADLERFPLAAQEWDDLASQIGAARDKLASGLSDGWRFGTLATDVGAAHDLFIGNVYEALATGSYVAQGIAQALRDTARDFGMTDAAQAEYLKTTEDRI